MDLVTGVMDRLIPKLEKLLGDEYELQTGLKKKVQYLIRELESIHAFLRKVSDVPWDQLNEQIKVWAREAREASYDMEDVLDIFHVRFRGREHASSSRLRRALQKLTSLFSMGKARRDISCAIQDIKNRLQEVADRRARYRIDDIAMNAAATTTLTVDPRLHAMYKEVANLVGIMKPRDDLLSILLSHTEDAAHRKIVAVVGIGGLGKTTLAKAVYEKVRADFDCGAFVPVGRNPNLTKVLMDILYDLDKERFKDIHTKNRDVRQLIDNLREFLIDKRFFIVIDDLWEDKSWIETIEHALLENNHGSRIIITTRNSQVAKKIGDKAYKMPPLSYENSRKLFYTRILGNEGKWHDNELDEIPNHILKKCDGVPLAIITMASMLVGKPRERWADICTSVGFGHMDDLQVDITMKILSFSYYDMPSHLRTCLLYLSIFPEDYEIDKNSLIWRWIAEGIIQGRPGIRLFEIGVQYFNDLVNRSMIQSIESESHVYGVVEGCRVHDMVLDFIRSISAQENFITILDNDEFTVSTPVRTARRIALHDNTIDHTAHSNTVDIPQLRSFAAFGCALGNWILPLSCKLLRVLDLEGSRNLRSSHLVHIGNLLHLRFLGLKFCTEIYKLPDEIGALKLLQTMNLECTEIRELTPSISQLTQLACLKCDGTWAPNWIGKLVALEELRVRIHIPEDSEEDTQFSCTFDKKDDHARGVLKALGNLTELRVFQSRVYIKMDESMQKDLVLSLRNLYKLQDLELVLYSVEYADTGLWGEGDFVFPQDLRVLNLIRLRFFCLPPCIGAASLPNLTQMSLYVHHVDQKDLEFLGGLPELCHLSLYTKSTVTIRNISAGNGYFRKLRTCCMTDSMIQLCMEQDSSVSFHIWNGIDAMPFCSSKNNFCLAPNNVMPNLEMLECQVFVRALNDSNMDWGIIIGLEYLQSLETVSVVIKCADASDAEVDDAQAALMKAAEVHSNHPTLNVMK